MDETSLPYDMWVQDALRSVVRRALRLAESRGLPGDHHYYITFRTDAVGVRMPARLRAQNPGEMTIVLQHRFWDLEVEDDSFSVTLTFSRISERLRIPFDAVTTFADPAVNFGLQIKPTEELLEGAEYLIDGEDAPSPATDGGEPQGSESTGEVITLDAFRKK